MAPPWWLIVLAALTALGLAMSWQRKSRWDWRLIGLVVAVFQAIAAGWLIAGHELAGTTLGMVLPSLAAVVLGLAIWRPNLITQRTRGWWRAALCLAVAAAIAVAGQYELACLLALVGAGFLIRLSKPSAEENSDSDSIEPSLTIAVVVAVTMLIAWQGMIRMPEFATTVDREITVELYRQPQVMLSILVVAFAAVAVLRKPSAIPERVPAAHPLDENES
ncbi:MAG: hypothetical protein KF777_16045 [Planctomycetaceae bacterium]|nr:hypothetical protein [Planctomycetaceae bacterium]